ncbi:MAG: hypothetical protein WA419_20480 [Silvibacterium sp.]
MQVRGTQSFIHILGECWRRPSLLALEIMWRWLFGIPLMAVLAWEAWRIYASIAGQLASTGINDVSIADPMRAAVVLSNVYAMLAPPILHLLLWLVPAAIIGWAVVSGIGRNAVLCRYDRSLPRRWAALTTLQLLRVIFLAGSVVLWFASIHWAAGATLWGDSPNIIGYCALVVGLSLGISTLWALVSWVFSIAPLLVLLEDRGIVSSLARSLRLGPLKGKLVEINLIMGIIKLALMVLAMVWSAMPLPFEAEVQGASLYAWWAVGTILYCIASDFFQVARLAAFIQLWRAFQPRNLNATQKLAASK